MLFVESRASWFHGKASPHTWMIYALGQLVRKTIDAENARDCIFYGKIWTLLPHLRIYVRRRYLKLRVDERHTV